MKHVERVRADCAFPDLSGAVQVKAIVSCPSPQAVAA
jgi:hypothetical protein